MVQKPELIAFAQYRLGGVQSFYYNILRHLPPDTFDLTWILDDSADKANAVLPKPYGICHEIIFKSDLPGHNAIFDKFSRLSEHISDRPGLVVTNFYLELGTLHTHRRAHKTIYFVCHDELYLLQAAEYEFLIDVYIAHNPYFYRLLCERFPHRKEQIFYLPYGIQLPVYTGQRYGDVLRVVFAARMVKEKGIFDLPEIIDRVESQLGKVHWTFMGDGPLRDEFIETTVKRENVEFVMPDNNEEVRTIMSSCNVFILPSYLDGLPVAMLEAMSVGCVPVVYRFNEGIADVLDPSEGFVIPSGDKAAFADAIIGLGKDRARLQRMGERSRAKVEEVYDIEKCALKYSDLFLRYTEFKRPVRHKFIAYGGMLEQPFVPSFIRKGIRGMRKFIKKSPSAKQ